MKFNRIIYLLLAIALPLVSFAKSDTQALFEKGNTAYAKAQYKQALADYQQILNAGYQSAALYFNMGNASYKDGEFTTAIWYYEKARKLSPGDEDINFNIRFANLKTTDKVDEPQEFFLTKWWRGFILSASLNALSITSILLVLFGSVLLIIYFFSHLVGLKKASFYIAIVLFVCGVFTIFIAAMQQSYFDSNKQAIIFTGTVNIKSGPAEQTATLFVLHDGTKVNILDTNNGWIKIKLANGNQGWLKKVDVKTI